MGRELGPLSRPFRSQLCIRSGTLLQRSTKSTSLNCICIFSKAVVEVGHSPFTKTFLINCSSCLVLGELSIIRKQIMYNPPWFSYSLLILAPRKLRAKFIVYISFAQFIFLMVPICFFPPLNSVFFIPNCCICLVYGPKLLKDPFQVGRALS